MNEAESKLLEVYEQVTSYVAELGFRKASQGLWMRHAHRPSLAIAIAARRIPFPSNKRITFGFQLVIGSQELLQITQPNTSPPEKTFKLGRTNGSLYKALLSGNAQRIFTVFPSTNVNSVAREICDLIEDQWRPNIAHLVTTQGILALMQRGWISAGNPTDDLRIVNLLGSLESDHRD